ncbi:MAG: ATP synthase F1 subunit epsilon [Proteobacteria bacterium]|nr:ATP synthase F1 subunit epsilon [Pseudomonadota bacterium]MDA1311116.1 ATP synthase F1 subunit epsilon [Pseudomonadota bacterium]
MADMVGFDLATPTSLIASEEAGMVVVPGSEGDFGVLPGHSPILTTVRPGVIEIHNDGAVTGRFFVSSGFAEANQEGCTVLVDEAVPVADIDRSAAEERVNAARTALQGADEGQRAAAETELANAEAMLAATQSQPTH